MKLYKQEFTPVQIKLVNNDSICFAELEREGYKENDIIEAEQEIINGTPKERYYFGNCVAVENITAILIKS